MCSLVYSNCTILKTVLCSSVVRSLQAVEMQNCFFFEKFYDFMELILKDGLSNGKYCFLGDFKYQNLVSDQLLIDQNKQKVLACLGEHYGKDSQRWFNRWRIFFLAVAELFGFAEGQEWVVKHYLFKK